jgi:hypothetical protein
MPCHDPEPTALELTQDQRNANLKKYGLHCTNNELISNLINYCCEMGDLICDLNYQKALKSDTLKWYRTHKMRDAEKQKLEKSILKFEETIAECQRQISSYQRQIQEL